MSRICTSFPRRGPATRPHRLAVALAAALLVGPLMSAGALAQSTGGNAPGSGGAGGGGGVGGNSANGAGQVGAGGAGGAGADGLIFGGGGSVMAGGAGGSVGAGLVSGPTGINTTLGDTTGGNGGDGASGATGGQYSGGGGGGGAAVYVPDSSPYPNTVTFNGTVTGGNGGNGGGTDGSINAGGGGGGDGILATGATLIINGTVTGGRGGNGGAGTYSRGGGGGGGGNGVEGAGLSVVLDGTLSGGMGGLGGIDNGNSSGDGGNGTNGDALLLTGGRNSLTLLFESVINGAVDVRSGASLVLWANSNPGLSGGTLGDIALINDGTTTINMEDVNAFTISGSMLGSGTLIVDGSGRMPSKALILTVANAYTGAVTITTDGYLILQGNGGLANARDIQADGTLDISTAASPFIHTLSGSGAVQLGANTLTLTAAQGAFSGGMHGSGGLTVAAGTEQLSGISDYTGATTIAQGATLALTGNGSIAGSSVVNRAGTFDITGTNAGASVSNLNGDGTVALGAQTLTISAASGAYDGIIGGTGGLAIASTGTYLLNGENTYSGGTTLLSGTLGLANNSAIGTGALAMGAGTGLAFGAAATTFANAISLSGDPTFNVAAGNTTTLTGVIADGTSPGDVVKTGAGTLVFAANETYTGGTDIQAGTLQVGTGGTTGTILGNTNIASGANLVFNRSDSLAYAGALSGAGTLTQQIAGTLTLTGDSSAFTGSTDVTTGTLQVDGRLGGSVNLASGTALVGTGTVGSATIANGASLSPGGDASIATLGFGGDLTLAEGSRYIVNANDSGQSDSLAVAGKATLGGGAVAVLSADGDWTVGRKYTILSAQGGVSGQFAGASNTLAFLAPELSYDATDVYLTLARNAVAFPDVGQTFNERNAGAALESQGAGALYQYALQQDTAGARQLFNDVSGEIHASVQSAALQDSRYVRDAVNQHLNGEGTGPEAATTHGTVWASTWGHWGDIGGDGNAARVQSNGSGLLVGSDAQLPGNTSLGVVLGRGQASTRAAGAAGNAHTTSTHLGIYAGTELDAFVLHAGVIGSRLAIDTHRGVTLDDQRDAISARYHATLVQGFVEAGYRIGLGANTLEPYVNVARVHLDNDHYQETGGDEALAASHQSTSLNTATLGVRALWQLDRQAGISAITRLGYQQVWSDRTPAVTQRFVSGGGDAFAIAGVPIARRTGMAELGLHMPISRNGSLEMSYLGQFGGGSKDQGARVSLNIAF